MFFKEVGRHPYNNLGNLNNFPGQSDPENPPKAASKIPPLRARGFFVSVHIYYATFRINFSKVRANFGFTIEYLPY